MKGKLIDLSFGMNRKQRITLELDEDFRQDFERLKDVEVLSIEIKKYRHKRSKTANAYFHVLAHNIAVAQGLGDEEVKKRLVCEYGALAKGSDGATMGLKIPVNVDITYIYPYTKWFDARTEGGVEFDCYMLYKQTHTMDSKEMARLIDGAIYEAKELGIATDTPEQLARYKEEWNRK